MMCYSVVKTGLDVFDACRAYGLAVLWGLSVNDDVMLQDAGNIYTLECDAPIPGKVNFSSAKIAQLFVADAEGFSWRTLFLTTKSDKAELVKEVCSTIKNGWTKVVSKGFLDVKVSTSGDKSLPGGLDPIAFKGLRGKTLSDCRSEKQLKVDALNWALACLGGAIAMRYKWQRTSGRRATYFAVFATPERIPFGNFREIKRRATERHRLNYMSVETSAAHYAVLLADEVRRQRATKRTTSLRFGTLHYFTLSPTGQQYKVSSGGNFALNRLIDFSLKGTQTDRVFEVWDYLFKVGGLRGQEEIAEAITRFVMRPSVETYEAHIKAFLRRMLQKGVKVENLYSKETLLEAMRYVETV